MAIQEHRCFSITCDVCKETLCGDEGGEMHFETEQQAIDNAGYHDWHTTATSAVCFTDETDLAHNEAIRELHAAAPEPCRCWIAENDAEEVEAAAPHLPAQDAETDRTGDGA